MQANCSDQSVAVAPSAESNRNFGQYLYQVGIIAAVVVFLLSLSF